MNSAAARSQPAWLAACVAGLVADERFEDRLVKSRIGGGVRPAGTEADPRSPARPHAGHAWRRVNPGDLWREAGVCQRGSARWQVLGWLSRLRQGRSVWPLL